MGLGCYLKTPPKQSLLSAERAKEFRPTHKQKEVTHETWIHSTVRNGTVPLSNTGRVNRKRPVATFGPALYGFKSRRTQPFDPSLGGSIRNETSVGSQSVPMVACGHWLCVRMSISSSSGRCCSSWRPSAIDTYAHAPQETHVRQCTRVRLRYIGVVLLPIYVRDSARPRPGTPGVPPCGSHRSGRACPACSESQAAPALPEADRRSNSTAREDRPITSQPRQDTVRQCDKAH